MIKLYLEFWKFSKAEQRKRDRYEIPFLPVAFLDPCSLEWCNFCCASLIASMSGTDCDRDLEGMGIFSIGGGGGGGGGTGTFVSFCSRSLPTISFDSESICVIRFDSLSLNVALNWRNSSSALSARIREIANSFSSICNWILSDSTSTDSRSWTSASTSRLFSVSFRMFMCTYN